MTLAILLALAFVGQESSPASGQAAGREALTTLAGRYEENRAKFDRGTIRFDHFDGYAESIDEARRGELTDGYKADGTYVYDGADGLYLCIYPAQAMAATSSRAGEDRLSNRLNSVRMLTDGRVSLYDRIFADPEKTTLRGDLISSGTEEFYRTAETPLDLGAPGASRDDLPRMARLALGGGAGIVLDEVDDGSEFEGVRAVRMKFHGPLGRRTLWLDPGRGAIPLQIHDEMPDGSTYTLHHGDIRQVPGCGWFPHERTTLVLGGRVKRIVVTRADFGPVSGDAFRLEFDEPTAMLDTARGLAYPPRKTWDLSKLPSAHAPGVTKVSEVISADGPVMPGEREPSRPYFTVGAVALSVIIGIVSLRSWMRRERR